MAPFLPNELIESLRHAEGFDAAAFIRVHDSGKQVTSVRLNPAKAFDYTCSLLNIEEDVPWCPYGKYLHERPAFTLDPLLHAGAYYVQEASSMFLWHVLLQTVGQNTSGLKALDLCAAPGGKSTLLASYFTDALIVSNEVIKSRASVLVENITKWGSDNVVVTNNDPKDFTILEEYFDVIVVDAPCSGSGLFRKNPEAISEWSEENVALCSLRQQRILNDIYPALKKNGLLIYSTCSLSVEEDEQILDWLSGKFVIESLQLQTGSDWGIIQTLSQKSAYGYRFYPDKLRGEGFFITAFRKKEGDVKEKHSSPLQQITKNELAVLKDWIKEPGNYFYTKQGENIIAFHNQWRSDVALLKEKLYLRKAGVTVGILKGKDMVPDHELALSLLMKENLPSVNLDRDNALQYLKKKELFLENLPKGWVAVTYCGINIGWAKVLHNRINNYYPLSWRILKD